MKSHTDTAACHSQLCYTSLEESTAEISRNKRRRHLEEAVSLVGIGKVCRRTDHVRYLLGKLAENGSRCVSCRITRLLLYCSPVHLRSIAAEPLRLSSSLFRIFSRPCLLFSMTVRNYSLEFLSTPCVKILHFVEDHERIFRITAEINNRIPECISTERCTMSLAVALI